MSKPIPLKLHKLKKKQGRIKAPEPHMTTNGIYILCSFGMNLVTVTTCNQSVISQIISNLSNQSKRKLVENKVSVVQLFSTPTRYVFYAQLLKMKRKVYEEVSSSLNGLRNRISSERFCSTVYKYNSNKHGNHGGDSDNVPAEKGTKTQKAL